MIITLLTDFGEVDGYVGAMKGVLLSIAPGAQLVDITHQIPAQDVRRAALVLLEAYPYFPPETVHLVVVDPGVGSERRAIAVQTPGGRFVAPDNGVLSCALAYEPEFTAVSLTNPAYHRPNPSHTFHGRDIFSPAAAHLARGVDMRELGPVVDDLVRFPLPRPVVLSSGIEGEILRIDHFGNALTNIHYLRWVDAATLMYSPALPGDETVELPAFQADQATVIAGGYTLAGIHPTYSAAPLGQPLAIVGSGGELEIAVRQGRAADVLSIAAGDPVILSIPES
jgi:S-adenosylmethionine hydrolase